MIYHIESTTTLSQRISAESPEYAIRKYILDYGLDEFQYSDEDAPVAETSGFGRSFQLMVTELPSLDTTTRWNQVALEDRGSPVQYTASTSIQVTINDIVQSEWNQ